ncbi:ankyrin, partial [Serendipita vermifera]
MQTAVEILLENRADADATGPQGLTALHYAASMGHLGIVQALISHGANVNFAKSGMDTPLQQAAMYGHHAVVRVLLQKGANINA